MSQALTFQLFINTVYVGTVDPIDPTGLTINWVNKANKFPGINKEIKIANEDNLTDAVKPVAKNRIRI